MSKRKTAYVSAGLGERERRDGQRQRDPSEIDVWIEKTAGRKNRERLVRKRHSQQHAVRFPVAVPAAQNQAG